MPVLASERVEAVVTETLRHVDALVLVDDGAPADVAAVLDDLARRPGVRLLRAGGNRGKGTAVAAGIAAALARDPDAVLVLDADGQHPPELIPAFVAAARGADVVIGDRRLARRAMPVHRRMANAASSALLSVLVHRRLRDAQNGMRLFRAAALRAAPPPAGRYEAETRHLKALIATGHDVGWVAMPAIYDGEPSGFRPVADGLRVLRAVLGGTPRPPVPKATTVTGVLRAWSPRIGLGVALAWSVAAALPLLAPLDEALLLAVNGLGDGPEWLYQALDPHSRNYLLLAVTAMLAVLVATRRLVFALGAVLAMLVAGLVGDLVLEVIQLGVDRPRPEEALGAEVQRSHARSWSHIPSFPSGHLMVTSAMVAAAIAIAPALRAPLVVYLLAVAATRMLFGAHFPLDVVVGGVVGWQVGLFSAALVRAGGLLPGAAASRPAARRRRRAGAPPRAAAPAGGG